jgi:hypothetical protein
MQQTAQFNRRHKVGTCRHYNQYRIEEIPNHINQAQWRNRSLEARHRWPHHPIRRRKISEWHKENKHSAVQIRSKCTVNATSAIYAVDEGTQWQFKENGTQNYKSSKHPPSVIHHQQHGYDEKGTIQISSWNFVGQFEFSDDTKFSRRSFVHQSELFER